MRSSFLCKDFRGPIKVVSSLFCPGALGIFLAVFWGVRVLTPISLFIPLTLIFAACGGDESGGARAITNIQTNSSGTLAIANVPPTVLAFDRSADDENVIIPVARNLPAQQLDVYAEPQLSQDGTQALSFVTGIGIEATFQVQQIGGGTQTIQLPVRMALRARKWDPETETLSAESQIFAPQGMSLDRAQEFTITDPTNTNFVMTGLGMLLKEGKFSKLELKRTALANMMTGGASFGGLSALNKIELPVGWAVVGLIIAVDKASAEYPPKEPYVSDVRMHTGLIMRISEF